MSEITTSPRWSLNWSGIKSALRHTIMPILAGAAVAALQAIQVGTFNLAQAKTAFVTAVIAGVIRLLQVFVTEQETVK